jgi:hypothetical protein
MAVALKSTAFRQLDPGQVPAGGHSGGLTGAAGAGAWAAADAEVVVEGALLFAASGCLHANTTNRDAKRTEAPERMKTSFRLLGLVPVEGVTERLKSLPTVIPSRGDGEESGRGGVLSAPRFLALFGARNDSYRCLTIAP